MNPAREPALDAAKSQLCGYFEEQSPAQAQLTFLGANPMSLLRFGPDGDGIVTYVTLGCSAEPMQDPNAMVLDLDNGPRAELILPVKGGLDEVIRPLAMVAASPTIEGLVLQRGALLDFGAPLWADSRFTGFVIVDSGIPAVAISAGSAAGNTIDFLQLVPATTNEFALARAKGVAELEALWQTQGVDKADPHRASAV